MRQIYITNAVQIVVSESNPQGTYTTVNGYPIKRDSRDYDATEQNPNGNPDTALIVAKADYSDAVRDLTIAKNSNRVGWAVTLERWDGVQIMLEKYGAFPDMTPQPELQPTPEPEGAEE